MGKKLLVVEDDTHLNTIYKLKLEAAGFEVTMALDGDAGIAALQGGLQPDLIVLDLLMPKKDGYQVLKELKEHPDFNRFPVIVTSNLTQEIEIEKIKELGAVDYVIKSEASLDQMIEKINAIP